MFAYCGNNPVDRIDPSGCSYVSTQKHNVSSDYAFAQEICVGVGGVAAIGLVLGSSLDDLLDEMLRKLERSLIKTGKHEYRAEYEVHHIAAKQAFRAARAARILNEVLPQGVEDPLNKVSLKTSVHRRIHNNAYYSLVNIVVVEAYDLAEGNPQRQYSNVVSVLGALYSFLESLNVLSTN